jgi:hypothetical protein
MYKIMNGKAPGYLSDLVPNQVQERTGYLLRNREQIDIPLARLSVFSNSFFMETIRRWNELDHRARNLPSVNAFKANYTRSLPKRIPLYYFGARLEAVIHARMRIGNSPLKADLCQTLHVISCPLCPCGSGETETVDHLFFKCRRYVTQRLELVNNLLPHKVDNVEHLLFGIPDSDHITNIIVFTAVHKYIRETNRLY